MTSAMHLRVAVLQAVFSEIATTRMAGLPLCNPALPVEALGFEPMRHADALASGLVPDPAPGLWQPPAAIGVLLTPWFMNLVCLPLQRDEAVRPPGHATALLLGGHWLQFITAHEPALGSFGACSLFSPMQDFNDAATARDTALAVLEALRPAPRQATLAVPARRSFLFGRPAAGGMPA